MEFHGQINLDKNSFYNLLCYRLNIVFLPNSWASLVAQMVKNLPAMWETQVQSLGWEDPLEKGMATHSSLVWRIPWTIPGLGRSPGEGNGNPLQSSCLENSVDRGAWWDTVCGFAKSQTWPSTDTVTTNAVYGNSLSKGGKAVSPANENRPYIAHENL